MKLLTRLFSTSKQKSRRRLAERRKARNKSQQTFLENQIRSLAHFSK